MAGTDQGPGSQHFAETLGEAGSAKNFGEKQDRAARIGDLRDVAEGACQFDIAGELVGADVQPGVDGGIGHAKFGLQFTGIAWWIIDQESWIDAKESSQQIARSVGHVRTRTAFDLGKISLAEAPAEFFFHGIDHFRLREWAAQTAERALDRAKGAEFVAEGHGRSLSCVLRYANCI
jgi:hypothetical protein